MEIDHRCTQIAAFNLAFAAGGGVFGIARDESRVLGLHRA